MTKQIGERVSIFAGLTIENLNNSMGDRPRLSLERNLELPVSARSRFAFRSRMTVPEVSLMRMRDMMKKVVA